MLVQTVAILCTDEKSKVACLFVTPRRPRSSLIEEWWINVHAFDLAGGALSNRTLSFEPSLAVPTYTYTLISLFPVPLSLSLSPFCILCACYRQEHRVVRNAFTPCDCQRTSSSFCRLLASFSPIMQIVDASFILQTLLLQAIAISNMCMYICVLPFLYL